MAPKQPCAKYQYVVTPTGPKILPVDEPSCKDEESPADYNAGGYLPVKVNDLFNNNRYRVIRKLGCVNYTFHYPFLSHLSSSCRCSFQVGPFFYRLACEGHPVRTFYSVCYII